MRERDNNFYFAKYPSSLDKSKHHERASHNLDILITLFPLPLKGDIKANAHSKAKELELEFKSNSDLSKSNINKNNKALSRLISFFDQTKIMPAKHKNNLFALERIWSCR